MQTFPNLYKSAYKCFVETYAKDGIRRGLYAGTVPALAANIAGLPKVTNCIVNFLVYFY
jgi:solute carrier family 25 ornithine transporter 2/15